MYIKHTLVLISTPNKSTFSPFKPLVIIIIPTRQHGNFMNTALILHCVRYTMPTTPKNNSKSANNRRGHVDTKKSSSRLKEKASSFHDRSVMLPDAEARIRRPKTSPDLFSDKGVEVEIRSGARPKLTKLLVNVTVQGGVGALQLIVSSDCTVGDLVAAAVRQYTKESRRPVIASDPEKFDLHYSQFSLENLNRDAKLKDLGSRNFFLCTKNKSSSIVGALETMSSRSPSCSNEVETTTKGDVGFAWLKFIDFLK